MFADSPENLPFAPGLSPFRLKGTGYRGHMQYAEAKVPGGVKAMIAGLHDPRLKEFFQQPFLASSWYDILPLLPAGRVCAALMRKPYEIYLRDRTRTQAQADLNGIYSMLLKIISTESVALRLPRIMSQYFDFGKIHTQPEATGIVSCKSSAIPRILYPWYQPVLTEYVDAALQIAGTGRVLVTSEPPENDGVVSGTPTIRFKWTIRWGIGLHSLRRTTIPSGEN